MQQSLAALTVLCSRYSRRTCVTGVAVCNDPSNKTQVTRLCEYYGNAIQMIRSCGMPAERVAVVFPVYERPEDKLATKWQEMFGDRHRNYCFDMQCFQCFHHFNCKTFAQQLRHTEENRKMLQEYPMVVGMWSLALGQLTWCTRGTSTDIDVYRAFGRAQLAAFREASHGHFFWNWTDRPDAIGWNFQVAYEKGCLSGPPVALPVWSGRGEDPLEEECNPSPSIDPHVFYGDTVCLRVWYGRYVDVSGPHVNAQWADKGQWQSLTFWHWDGEWRRGQVEDGDTVSVWANNSGRFLSVGPKCTIEATKTAGAAARFVVRVGHGQGVLRHGGTVYLESRGKKMLDADKDKDGIFARYKHGGDWQQFVVEKVMPSNGADPQVGEEAEEPPTQRRRSRSPRASTTEAPHGESRSSRVSSPERMDISSEEADSGSE